MSGRQEEHVLSDLTPRISEAEKLKTATALHQQGDLDGAKTLYEEILATKADALVSGNADVAALKVALSAVNEALWDIEDRIRIKEHMQAFDAEFIDLARSVYKTNDRRAALKKQINVLLQSRLVEEKSYAHS